MRATKWLLVGTSLLSTCVIAVQAQGQTGVISVDLKTWTPATFLAVASVIFSFGISYQTLRVHGKVLRDLESWRRDHVDPKLSDHDVQLGVLGGGGRGRR